MGYCCGLCRTKKSALGTTPAGAKVYGCWAGGEMPLDSWLRMANVTLQNFDELPKNKKLAPGGTFLFTHQRDMGCTMSLPRPRLGQQWDCSLS